MDEQPRVDQLGVAPIFGEADVTVRSIPGARQAGACTAQRAGAGHLSGWYGGPEPRHSAGAYAAGPPARVRVRGYGGLVRRRFRDLPAADLEPGAPVGGQERPSVEGGF